MSNSYSSRVCVCLRLNLFSHIYNICLAVYVGIIIWYVGHDDDDDDDVYFSQIAYTHSAHNTYNANDK